MKPMNALKENMVKKMFLDMEDRQLKDAVREVFCWFKDGDLEENGMLLQVANDIDKITEAGDYMKLRMAEQSILEEAARRYVLPKDSGMKLVKKEG